MERKADTHIRVTEDTWAALNARKRPGDSFDDVIQRLLEKGRERQSEDHAHAGQQEGGAAESQAQFDADDEELLERLDDLKD